MCRGGSVREQINKITAFIDGSNIYGSDKETSDKLRTHQDGLLKTHSHFTVDNLPMRSQCHIGSPDGTVHPTHVLTKPSDLVAGDRRVTATPTLASMHTLFLNEHNRIARAIKPFLAKKKVFLSSDSQDEFIFQASIASTQILRYLPWKILS